MSDGPVIGNGVVDLGEVKMPASDQFVTLCEQRFYALAERSDQERARLQGMRDNVAEQTELGYLTEQRVVGVREAKASTLLQPVVGQPVPVGLSGTVGQKTGV